MFLFDITLNDNSIWWSEHLSFVLYLYSGGTNSGNASPIYFNQSGHANNYGTVQLQVKRNYRGGFCSIQINISAGYSDGVDVNVRAYKVS